MKITKTQLKKIIKEELKEEIEIINEADLQQELNTMLQEFRKLGGPEGVVQTIVKLIRRVKALEDVQPASEYGHTKSGERVRLKGKTLHQTLRDRAKGTQE
jgi:hypothetical protein